jgi:uncharacterized glyoxalase superfamily protein PhnB
MKPTPAGWPRASSSLFYTDATKAIDWLCAAFGFEVRIKVDGPNGHIMHSELTYGDAVIMAATANHDRPAPWPKMSSPSAIGGVNTQSLFLYVDDVDAHHDRAVAAGATVVMPPKVTDYGPEHWADKGYACLDPEGHLWYFAHRVRDPK